MKANAMSTVVFLAVLAAVPAMAEVKCYLGVGGQSAKLLAESNLLQVALGSFKAVVIPSLDDENSVYQIQLEDTSRNIKVMAGEFSVGAKPATLILAGADKNSAILSCQR